VTRPLRIVLCNSGRRWIGEAGHCWELHRVLRSRGHEVLLVCRRGYDLHCKAIEEGIPHRALALSSRFTGWSDLLDLIGFGNIVRRFRPDVVHCHRGKDHWLAAAALAGRRHRPALVRTRHVTVPVRNHVFNRWLYQSATQAVICVSQETLRGFGGLLPEGAGQRESPTAPEVRVIHAAVDSERFHPRLRDDELRKSLGAAPGDRIVGLIARYQKVKGQAPFLHSARRVLEKFPAARFVLAGRGSQGRIESLRREATRMGIQDRVTFLGWIEDLPPLLASLDVGVVASLGSEGSSRIALEYFASGVPVVATSVGGLPELVEENKAGFLVPPNRPAEMAEILLRVLTQDDLRSRLATAAREAAETRFLPDRWASETEDVYEKALSLL